MFSFCQRINAMSIHHASIFSHRTITPETSAFELKPVADILQQLGAKQSFDVLQMWDKTVSQVDILAFYMRRDPQQKEYRVIDVGTGSGLIPVLLAKQLQASPVRVKEYHGIDNDINALSVATNVANKYNVPLQLRDSNMLQMWPYIINNDTTPNIVLSANLPYNTEQEWQTYNEAVRAEPKHAIVSGGEDGLDHYRKLIDQLQSKIDQIHMLIFQGSSHRAHELLDLCKTVQTTDMKFYLEADCFGKDRFVV